jgi:hypothetical protein
MRLYDFTEKIAKFSPKIGKNRQKFAKIAENSDHGIGPRVTEVSFSVTYSGFKTCTRV